MAGFLPDTRRASAFTLIEMMAAAAVFSLILFVIFSVTQQMGNAWRSARSKVESFQGARLAFEAITRTLSQATLNTYYDYFDALGHSRPPEGSSSFSPHHYGRQSNLHFISGSETSAGTPLVSGQVTHAVFFQNPRGYAGNAQLQGMDTLLNACGFFIRRSEDTLRPGFLDDLPHAPPNPIRYRLMQFLQPSENLEIYNGGGDNDWFTKPLAQSSPPIQQLAENVIALILLPRWSAVDGPAAGDPLPPDYNYDSRKTVSGSATQLKTEHQLPPLVEVVLVAIDEASARRLGDKEAPTVEFKDPANFDKDLKDLEGKLVAQGLTYRIFRTTVALRNSKWSSL